MEAVCTICSKSKREDLQLLPARLRYSAPHIVLVEKIAQESHKPFFILSGKYGLISAEEEIPNYDYYLEENAIDSLAKVIGGQLSSLNILQLHFYTESKPTWAPYELALTKGANLAKTDLKIYSLK